MVGNEDAPMMRLQGSWELRLQPPGVPGRVQWVKRPTLVFGSGRDLAVRAFEPRIGLCADSSESAWDHLSPLAVPPLLTLFLSLSL